MAGELPNYPKNHKVGVRVPKGGSACSKCEYVDGQKCKQKDWIRWNGNDIIPAPTDEYCCDFFESKEDITQVTFESVGL